jgi:hypothetical protein
VCFLPFASTITSASLSPRPATSPRRSFQQAKTPRIRLLLREPNTAKHHRIGQKVKDPTLEDARIIAASGCLCRSFDQLPLDHDVLGKDRQGAALEGDDGLTLHRVHYLDVVGRDHPLFGHPVDVRVAAHDVFQDDLTSRHKQILRRPRDSRSPPSAPITRRTRPRARSIDEGPGRYEQGLRRF